MIGWRAFLVGLACGGIAVGLAWFASTYWAARKPPVAEPLSPRATRWYNECLVAQKGSIELCDAMMRMRDAYERLKK